jgi:hypothetical protein
MKEIKKSLKVGREALQVIEDITGKKVVELFNDSYPDEQTRRLKFCFHSDDYTWISNEQYKQWNEEFMKRARGGEFFLQFQPVNKLKSMGGKDALKRNIEGFVSNGIGTKEEYMERFNNEHYYFVLMIKGNGAGGAN